MEFRHLRYFVAVAEELNFTRAAEKLHVSQPPLSRQIRQLEDELGIQLFARGRKGVFLTSVGQLFLKEARTLLEQADHALATIRPSKEGAVGLVRVGVGAGLGKKFARVLSEHEKVFPGVEIRCKDLLSCHQVEQLRNRSIDVGLLRPPVEGKEVISEFLCQEAIRVILPTTNHLAKRRSVRLRELANETLLLHDRDLSGVLFDMFLHLYRQVCDNPRIVYTQTGAHEEAGMMLVAAGKGVFLIPAGLIDRCVGNGVTTVLLAEPSAVIEVHMAWRRGEKSPAILNLLKTIRKIYKT